MPSPSPQTPLPPALLGLDRPSPPGRRPPLPFLSPDNTHNDGGWRLDVYTVVPRQLVHLLSSAVAATSEGLWHCLASASPTSSSSQVYLWYDAPNASLEELKERGHVLELLHDGKLGSGSMAASASADEVLTDEAPTAQQQMEEGSVLLALDIGSPPLGRVYAVNTHTGALLHWKTSSKDVVQGTLSGLQPSCTAILPLDVESGERVTSLDVGRPGGSFGTTSSNSLPAVAIGTSLGRLFWVQQTASPLSFQVPEVVGGNERSTTLLSRLFSPAASRKRRQPHPTHEGESSSMWSPSAIVQTLFLPSSNNGLVVVGRDKLTHWDVSVHSETGKADLRRSTSTGGKDSLDLVTALNEHVQRQSSSNSSSDDAPPPPPIVSATILAATVGHHHSTTTTTTPRIVPIHALVRAEHAPSDQPLHGLHHRLYWVVANVVNGGGGRHLLWAAKPLHRFSDPSTVHVRGMVVTEPGWAYAAIGANPPPSSSGGGSGAIAPPLLFLALDEVRLHDDNGTQSLPQTRGSSSSSSSGGVVAHEFEIPAAEVGQLWTTLRPDVVTHGCCALTTSGLGLRIRRLDTPPPIATTSDSGVAAFTAAATATMTTNPATVQTLLYHLRAAFREAYANPTELGRLPPSLLREPRPDVEAAVTIFARELQTAAASGVDPAVLWERHTAFVHLLRQAGLYRTLSSHCRWTLLGLGQQIVVVQSLWEALSADEGSSLAQDFLPQLQATNASEWLVALELHVYRPDRGVAGQQQFLGWLCGALEQARDFRSAQALALYDIAESAPGPVDDPRAVLPLWTTEGTLQALLTRQLSRWESNQGSRSVVHVETVVSGALTSFADAHHVLQNPESESSYAALQGLAIPLLRSVKGIDHDELAWTLCQEHLHFEGICQIAYDHEHRSDRDQYMLDPLFRTFNGKSGAAQAGLPFCQFVLRWHSARNLSGHVLQYGERCPGALGALLENDENLRPFLWIQALRHQDYDKAADSLLGNAKRADAPPAHAKGQAALASLAHSVAVPAIPGDTERRRSEIDKIRDLAELHEELYQVGGVPDHLLEPELLLEHALSRLATQYGRDQKAKTYFQCLAVCTTFGAASDASRHASEVWLRAILEDSQWFRERIGAPDAGLVLEETVFGGLLRECVGSNSGWESVLYAGFVAQAVALKLPPEIHRILVHAASLLAVEERLQ